MSTEASANAPLLVDIIDFQVPCRRFTIKANVTRDRQMPVVDEFVLRLIHLVQRISIRRLAGYFGFTGREIETVLLELIERGLVEGDEHEIYLSAQGLGLFKGVEAGDLPRLAAIESWSEGVWFDLISRSMMKPERFRAVPHLVPLRELPGTRRFPDEYAREAFEQNFHDYAKRVRRHPDADQLAIYSISGTEAGIYGYQPLMAECVMSFDGGQFDSQLKLPITGGKAAALVVAAADAWGMLSGPEPSASGRTDYERLTGDDRPARFADAPDDLSVWTDLARDDESMLLSGATYLDRNIERLAKVIAAAVKAGASVEQPAVLWLRPGGTAWGRTFKVGDALAHVRNALTSNARRPSKTIALIPRSVPGAHRRSLRRIFDEGLLAPSGVYPADLEILLVQGVAAIVALHMDVGRHGAAIGLASRDARLLQTLERRLLEPALTSDDRLWAPATESHSGRAD